MPTDIRSNRQILYEAASQKIPQEELLPFDEFSKLLDAEESKTAVFNELSGLGIPLGTYEEFSQDVKPDVSLGKDIRLGLRDAQDLFTNILSGVERIGQATIGGMSPEQRAEYIKNVEENPNLSQRAKENLISSFKPAEEKFDTVFEEETLPQGPGVDYGKWTPKGLVHSGVQSLPQVAGYAALFMAGPGGMALAGVGEAESVWQDMDRYEEETGQKVDPIVRATVPPLVGAANVALERMSLGKWGELFKAAPGLKKFVGNFMMSALTESTEEAGQELASQIAKLGYNPDDFNLQQIPEAMRQAVATSFVLGPLGALGQFKNKNTGELKPVSEMTVEDVDEASKQMADAFDDKVMEAPGFKNETRIDRVKALIPKKWREGAPEGSIRRMFSNVFMKEDALSSEEGRFLGSEVIEAAQRIDNESYRNDFDLFNDITDEGNMTKLGKFIKKKKLEQQRKDITQSLRKYREIQQRVETAKDNIVDAEAKIQRRQKKLEKAKTLTPQQQQVERIDPPNFEEEQRRRNSNPLTYTKELNKVYRGVSKDSQYTINEDGSLTLNAASNFEGRQQGISMSPYQDVALDYATRSKQGTSKRVAPEGTVIEITDPDFIARLNPEMVESFDEISYPENITIPKDGYRIKKLSYFDEGYQDAVDIYKERAYNNIKNYDVSSIAISIETEESTGEIYENEGIYERPIKESAENLAIVSEFGSVDPERNARLAALKARAYEAYLQVGKDFEKLISLIDNKDVYVQSFYGNGEVNAREQARDWLKDVPKWERYYNKFKKFLPKESTLTPTQQRLQKEIKALNNIKDSNQRIVDDTQAIFEKFQETDQHATQALELGNWFDKVRAKVIESLTTANAIENVVNQTDTFKGYYNDFLNAIDNGELSKATKLQDLRKYFEEQLLSTEEDLANDKEALEKRVDELAEVANKHIQALNWGKDQYVTNIEIGQWKVKDQDGRVVAVAETRKKAREKANKLLGTEKDGYKKKGYEITAEFEKPLDPLAKRDDVLKGEDDVFKALHVYSPRVRTFIEMNPIKAMLKQQQDRGTLSLGEHNVLSDMINDTESSPYTMIEKAVDDFLLSVGYGGKGRVLARAAGTARKVQAVKKLGGRLVGGFINSADGLHKIWVKNNLPLMKQAVEFLNTEEGQRLIQQEEQYLGVDFVTSSLESQYLKKEAALKKKILHAANPVFFHAWPEPFLRKFSYAVNYLDAKQNRGMSEYGARKSARRQVRVQQGIYLTAALPGIFRTVPGKVILQFRSFVANHVAFLGTLSGRELARHLGFMLAMTGPKGAVLFLKSLPLLGMMGALDELEAWVLKTFGKAGAGVPGAVGGDVSGSMTINVLNGQGFWENMGPFLSDASKVFTQFLQPIAEGIPVTKKDVRNYFMMTMTMAKYFNTIIDHYFGRTHELEVDDTLIRNPYNREPIYKPTNDVEYAMLAAGIKPTGMVINESAIRLAKRYDQINKKAQFKYLDIVLDRLDRGMEIDEDLQNDLIRVGLTSQLRDMIEGRVKVMNMSPDQRLAYKVKLSNYRKRLELMDISQGLEDAESEFVE